MNVSVGIVGLPNVGKSTLFNAVLKKQQALAANYPFATIEPNIGIVEVPDQRLAALAKITSDELQLSSLPPIKSATIEFVDIAGLVKGASSGAGLGNKFLSHVREVNILCHLIRVFSDENIIREGSIDPVSDFETIKTELILSDLQTVENVQSRMKRFAVEEEKNAIEKLFKGLNQGVAASEIILSDEEEVFAKSLFLLSKKPEIIVLNVSEPDYSTGNISKLIEKYASHLRIGECNFVVISAKIESELASLSENEQKEYFSELGLSSSGLERLIQHAYRTLNLISFLTAGEKEVRAWTIKRGTDAVTAAGTIHSDFSKKFIKAEIVSYNDFISLGGWKKAREKGKTRLEGKEYRMQDGDIVEFKIGS